MLGGVFGSGCKKAKPVQIGYEVNVSAGAARACCYKVCQERIQPCIKDCGPCADPTVCIGDSPDCTGACQCVLDCQDCSETCEGGGSASDLDFGWTPDPGEWAENEHLLKLREDGVVPARWQPAALPKLCR